MDGKEDKSLEVSRKMKVGNVSARARRKQDQTLAGAPSIVPWKPILKWSALVLAVSSVVVLGGYVAYRIYTAPPPIDLDQCPRIAEVAGAATISLNGVKAEPDVGEPVLPGSQIVIGQSSSIRLTFPDGNAVSLYSGSKAKTPDEFIPAVFLKSGSAYAEGRATVPIEVRTPHGITYCKPGSSASIEVARSRCRVDVESGHTILESTGGRRRMVILAGSTGEVGTGAIVGGVKSSEADEDITYPGLEIAQVSMYDANRDHVLTAFDPMKDGSIYHHIEEATPLLDFRVIPNSTKTVKLETELFRIEDGRLESVIKSTVEPIEGEARICAAFGAKLTEDRFDYKGQPIPLGDYQITFRPFADDGKNGVGNGVSLTLRFSIDDKRDRQE